MEKCTFCVQRIKRAEDQAKSENRLLADGEVQTACAQVCPSNAIIFGRLDDPESRVSILARNGRAVQMLDYLGTLPSVTYLKGA
jgi:molybdopterin-containing oxidoreductase family iron-sulfur binding subunit